jgi:hypothetical protein
VNLFMEDVAMATRGRHDFDVHVGNGHLSGVPWVKD